jgi:signal transduction histidine kinase
MAKEAAHQLGTPLSSILAWIEIMKMNSADPELIEEYLGEMQNDIDRLNKITIRFSKIGSMPEMKKENLADLIDFVTVYFEKRLPNLGKRIQIKKKLDHSIETKLNHDLMEWVFENLIKNAAESIDSKDGLVEISLNNSKKSILIQVKDNGKGMSNFIRRQVFNPGFTTKKRGWGLGLSLTKRIVEEYHKGRIYIKESVPGKGTIFIVELPHHEQIN